MAGVGAVRVDCVAGQKAAANRTPPGFGGYGKGVCGLVVHVVATGEPGATEYVGIFLKGYTKVVVDVVVHVKAAPAVAFHIAVRYVGDGESVGVAGMSAGEIY